MRRLCLLPALVAAFGMCRAATNSVPHDLGSVIVEATPISKYRSDTVSTATFTDLPAEELPQTVDVLTSDFVEDINPTDLHDLLRYQPGVFTGGRTMMSRTSGQYTLRGMPGSDVMLDGTLGLSGPMGIFMDPFVFERIEIVKGPVGSTVGGSTSTMGPYGAGGSINLISKQPQPGMSFNNVNMISGFGEDLQRYRIGTDLNHDIVDGRLTLRLPVSFDFGSPYYATDSYDWRESYTVAPSMLLIIRDDLRIGVNTTFQYIDQPGYQGIPVYRGRPYGRYDWDSNDSTSDMRDEYIAHSISSFLEWDANRYLTLRVGAGISQADIEFEHLGPSAYADSRNVSTPYSHMESDSLSRQYNVYQRGVLAFETGEAEHQFVAQGDYSRKTSQGRSYFENVGSADDEHVWVPENYRDSQLEKYGVFAQDLISWGDFRFLTGIRYDYHESDIGNTGDAVSPRAGITYMPLEQLAFFGNISQSAAPNFGYMKSETEELTSEWQATQYESGFRFSPVQALWFQTSFFMINQKDKPVFNEETEYYEAGAEGESRGVEVSLTGDIQKNWSVYAAYSYSEYEDKTDDIEFDNTPPHTFTASTSYRIDRGMFDDVVLGFGYRFRDKYYSTFRGQYVGPDYYISDSHVFDASVAMPLSKFGGSEDFVLKLAVKNIFGEDYIESNRHYYQCFPGNPRAFEIGLNAKF
ncbi:MAG: TonB-dependent receptor [Kiritimatiellia bacterium]